MAQVSWEDSQRILIWDCVYLAEPKFTTEEIYDMWSGFFPEVSRTKKAISCQKDRIQVWPGSLKEYLNNVGNHDHYTAEEKKWLLENIHLRADWKKLSLEFYKEFGYARDIVALCRKIGTLVGKGNNLGKETAGYKNYTTFSEKWLKNINSGLTLVPGQEYRGTDNSYKFICKAEQHETKKLYDNATTSGCNTCHKIKVGTGVVYSEEYFKEHPEIAEAPGVLYLVLLTHEEEIRIPKVGIAKGDIKTAVAKRYKNYSCAPYAYKLEDVIVGTTLENWRLEQYLLLTVYPRKGPLQYKPNFKFAGHTECIIPEKTEELKEWFKKEKVKK